MAGHGKPVVVGVDGSTARRAQLGEPAPSPNGSARRGGLYMVGPDSAAILRKPPQFFRQP